MANVIGNLAIVEDPHQAAALTNPLRLRVLESLAEPDSASGVARRLGEPRQKINFHLRELERVGLVDFVEERTRGNCLERIVRAKAAHFVVSPAALGSIGDIDPIDFRDRFSWSYLVAVAGRAIRDLATLRRGADRAGKKLPTFTLETNVRFKSPVALREFSEEISNALATIVAKHHEPDAPQGREFHFFVGGYPAVTAPDSAPAESSKKEADGEQAEKAD